METLAGFSQRTSQTRYVQSPNPDLGEELWNLTPPWGVLGLGYSLRDSSFNFSNYSNSSYHALGTLADQLVRKGMLDAATAGGEDHRKDGETDQQHQAVDAKPE